MLIELFGRNFRSFRDEFRLSMVAADIDRDNPRGIIEVELEGDDEPLRLLRCAAIYGPNASGKSTVLWAANALEYLCTSPWSDSSEKPILAYEPFLLNGVTSHEPTQLGIRAVVNKRLYEYVIEFDMSEFHRERLVEIAYDEEKVLVDRRDKDVSGEWTKERQFELIAESFRPNALLLRLADSLAPSLTLGLAAAFRRLVAWHDPSRVFLNDHGTSVAQRAHWERETFGDWLIELLRGADVGIVGYETEVVEKATSKIWSRLGNAPSDQLASEYRLRLSHASSQGPCQVDYHQESKGTQKIAELAPFMYELTHGVPGRAYFIDEIGASMHPDLLRSMIRHFNCEVPQERVSGQLIFATHETSLIDAEAKDAILRRDQVYLTEKDNDGASRLYSVADFKERNNLNLRRRYLQGRYGALPSLGSFGD